MLFKGKTGTYERVVKSIVRVRDPGDRPRSDLFSLDDFICDLCNAVVGRSRIIQCTYCGRWVCRESCWDAEHLACIACASKIRLSLAGARVDLEAARVAARSKKGSKGRAGSQAMRRVKRLAGKRGSAE